VLSEFADLIKHPLSTQWFEGIIKESVQESPKNQNSIGVIQSAPFLDVVDNMNSVSPSARLWFRNTQKKVIFETTMNCEELVSAASLFLQIASTELERWKPVKETTEQLHFQIDDKAIMEKLESIQESINDLKVNSIVCGVMPDKK
jgi:hypothetical protein